MTKPARHSPLHVPPLRATEGKDAVLSKDVQAHGIDTLLVDDDEVLGLLVRADHLVANLVLEFDDLLQLVVNELALRLDELFTLFGRRVEESRVDLAAIVLVSVACE